MVLLLAAICLIPAVASCSKARKAAAIHEKLFTSTFAIDVSFGMLPTQVHDVLGEPNGEVTRQSGVNLEEYYLPPDAEARAEGVPELSLTYINNKLVKLDNRYYPAAEEEVFPPFFIEPVEAVKLGMRRSDFVDALGEPETGPAGEFWRFMGKDDSIITVRADFTDMETTGDALCERLVVTHTPAVTIPMGEDVKKTR